MKRSSHGVAMAAWRLMTDPDGRSSAGPAIRIQGTEGEIQVDHPAFRPERFRVIPRKEEGKSLEIREVQCSFPGEGHGMYWEADEAARCIRDGKLESETMPWDESTLIMEILDEVRQQNGLKYPEDIESSVVLA
jgi:predicted dehydrogenase